VAYTSVQFVEQVLPEIATPIETTPVESRLSGSLTPNSRKRLSRPPTELSLTAEEVERGQQEWRRSQRLIMLEERQNDPTTTTQKQRSKTFVELSAVVITEIQPAPEPVPEPTPEETRKDTEDYFLKVMESIGTLSITD
jgi:hypothetical protein